MNKGLSGHEVREVALQALFPLDFNANLTKEDAIFNVTELDRRDMTNEDESEFVPVYLDTLVGSVCAKKDELDKVIEEHLKNSWYVNRISEMNLVILRIAIFEITCVTNVPTAVALGEAVELAETFNDGRSCKFVNGILSDALKGLGAGA